VEGARNCKAHRCMIGRTHGTYGGAQKYMYSFGRENIQKGTTWKTKAQTGG